MLVPKRLFAIAGVVAKESTRYAISGVLAERREDGACRLAATDGKRAITVDWSDEAERKDYPAIAGDVAPKPGFSAILPAKPWVEAGKQIPNSGTRPVLQHCLIDETAAGDTVTLASTDLETVRRLSVVPSEGRFPAVDDVFPQYTIGEDADRVHVDPVSLADTFRAFARVIDHDGNGRDPGRKGIALIIPRNPRKPIILESKYEGATVRAVQMPVRGPDGE